MLLPVAPARRSHVGLDPRRPKRRADEARARPAANDDTGATGIGAAQLQLVGGVQHGAEPERPREGFRADQIGFLEFQPR